MLLMREKASHLNFLPGERLHPSLSAHLSVARPSGKRARSVKKNVCMPLCLWLALPQATSIHPALLTVFACCVRQIPSLTRLCMEPPASGRSGKAFVSALRCPGSHGRHIFSVTKIPVLSVSLSVCVALAGSKVVPRCLKCNITDEECHRDKLSSLDLLFYQD